MHHFESRTLGEALGADPIDENAITELSEEYLLMVHGGKSPEIPPPPPDVVASSHNSTSQPSTLETMTKDANTIAAYGDAGAHVGGMVGTIAGGPDGHALGQEAGGFIGTGFGIGVVIADHFGDDIVNAASNTGAALAEAARQYQANPPPI